MDFLKKLDFKKAFKIVGIVLVAVIVIAFGLSFITASYRAVMTKNGIAAPGIAQMMGGYGGGSDAAYGSKSMSGDMMISTRNVAPIAPQPGYATGNTAEAYEVTDYSGSIETRSAEKTCADIMSIKAKEYVIFENSSEYEQGCSFTFKVEKAHVAEILSFVKALDPRDLSENTQTIKSQVDDYTSEIEILQNKQKSIEETLASALKAYDGITALATKTQDASTLAKVIDSKVQVIERLTQERININAELDRLSRAKAEQLDRLDYTYFRLNVYENRYLDGQSIKDSWKGAVKDFVRTFNKVLQGITIGLVGLLLLVVQFALYVLIVLLIAKYGWRLIRRIWSGK